MATEVRYWDTGPFLAWLKPEPHRLPDVAPIVKAAEAGAVKIVTSSVTLIEVVKLDAKDAVINLPAGHAAKISGWFERTFISVRTFDRVTAEIARQLIWDHDLKTRDAMHLATCIRWRVALLETYDGDDLVPLSGKVGDPVIEIRTPRYDAPPEEPEPEPSGLQTTLDFDAEEPPA